MNNSEKVSSASPSPNGRTCSSANIKKPNKTKTRSRSNSWSSGNSKRSRSHSRSSSITRSASPVSPAQPQIIESVSVPVKNSLKRRTPPPPSLVRVSSQQHQQQTGNHRPRRSRTRSRSRSRSRNRDSKRLDTYDSSHRNSSSSSYYHYDNSDNDRERAEQYTSICIKNLNEKVDIDHLYDNIYSEFKRYGQFTIKIVNNKKTPHLSHSYTERIAFVNFYNHETARQAKRDKMHKNLCGLPMYIEPVYKNYKPGTIPPPPPSSSSSSSNYYDVYPSRSRSPPLPPPPPPPPPSSSNRNYRTSPYRVRRSRSRSPNNNLSYNSSSYQDHHQRYNRSHDHPYTHHHHHQQQQQQQQHSSSSSSTYDSYRKGRSPPPNIRRAESPSVYYSKRKRSLSPQPPAPPPPPPPPLIVNDSRSHYYSRRRSSRSPVHQIRTPPLPVSVPKIKQDDLAYKLSRSRTRSRSRSPSYRSSRSGRSGAQPPPLAQSIGQIASTHGGVTHYFDNDEKDATRTLFIGNLDQDIEKDYLMKLFERYGNVEDIDIKKNIPAQPPYMIMNSSNSNELKKTYAFVRYENMDMAKEAKLGMNGKRIGHNEIKIGYGKVQATNCLWIGGLTDKSRIKDLEREIKYILNTNDSSKFDILHKPPDLHAFILFYNVKHAEQVRYDLRGKSLPGGTSDKLRIDFHDPKQFNLLKINNPKSNQPTIIATTKKTDSSTGSSKRSHKSSNSRSPTPRQTRRVVQDKEATPPKEKPKPNAATNQSVPSTNSYENIIITKTDNERRVETKKEENNKSRSRSPVKQEKRNTPSPSKESKQELVAKMEETVKELDTKLEENSSQQNRSLNSSRRHHHRHHKQHTNGTKPKDDRDEGELVEEESTPVSNTRQVINKENLLINDCILNKLIVNKSFKSVNDLKLNLEGSCAWSGLFTLKKNTFPTKFYLLAGNKNFSEKVLPLNTKSDDFMNLQINQRIRLDSSKLEDIEKRIVKTNDAESGLVVYLALAADLFSNRENNRVVHQKRSLHNLVTYLNQKSAAGVVSLPDDYKPLANLNIFAPGSNLSFKLLKQLIPDLKLDTQTNLDDYLIIVLLENLNSNLNNININ